MSSVFISYSRKDKAVADYIAAELRNRNVDVFVDYERLKSGGFVPQLGRKIEENNYFITILSPRSVGSKWVIAEITWAFSSKNTESIIPIKLETASLTNVFVVASLEQVDFTRWNVDRNMDEAIRKLARLMNISSEPIKSEPVPEPMLSADHNEEELESENVAPTFEKGDVTTIFQSAAAVQNNDPEQALFLYQQVLEIDPTFMGGTIKKFVERQQETLKPIRLAKLRESIESAKKQGRWAEAKQLSESMINIDTENEYALQQIKIVTQNIQCEPVYEQAKIAKELGSIDMVKVLMADISNTCPDYGDPSGLFTDQPITRDRLGFVHNTHIFEGHTGRINKVAFSQYGDMIATASEDKSIKIWNTFSGDMLIELKVHSESVNSIAFSPDNQYLASASDDGKVNLWRVSQWTLIQQFEYQSQLNDLAFSPNGKALAICGNHGLLQIHDVPQISSHRIIEVEYEVGYYASQDVDFSFQNDITSVEFSLNGKIFYCTQNITTRSLSQNSSERYSNIRFWETKTLKKTVYSKIEKMQYLGINNSCLSYDKKFIAISKGSLDILTIPAGSIYYTSRIHIDEYFGGEISNALFSPIDHSLLIYSDAQHLTYFDLDTKSEIKSEKAHNSSISSMAMSSDGRLIATGSDDCTVKIWQL